MLDRLGTKFLTFNYLATLLAVLVFHEKDIVEFAKVIVPVAGFFFGLQFLREQAKKNG